MALLALRALLARCVFRVAFALANAAAKAALKCRIAVNPPQGRKGARNGKLASKNGRKARRAPLGNTKLPCKHRLEWGSNLCSECPYALGRAACDRVFVQICGVRCLAHARAVSPQQGRRRPKQGGLAVHVVRSQRLACVVLLLRG